MEDRIERLENLVALQERTMEKLNDSLADQQQQLLDLERLAQRLAIKVRELDADMEDSGPIDTPPPTTMDNHREKS